MSPHYQLFGTKPVLLSELGLEELLQPVQPMAKELHDVFKEIRQLAADNTKKAQATYKKQYDKHRRPAIDYKPEDLVLLHYKKSMPNEKFSPKLSFHARGPYRILRRLPDRDSYVIRLVAKMAGQADRETTVNADQIRPYKRREPVTD